ncbi:unnamed protein product [Orchesella dallaii]|uniref:Voltage-dependent calcium channel gamma-8 subunit n=1 Tax=Orchesella dallaii TaxID=48710 RepID=A0ABP1R186_9HEXA
MTKSRSSSPSRKGMQVHRVVFSPTTNTSGGGENNGPKPQSKETIEKDKQKRLRKVARAKERRELVLKRIRTEKKLMLFSSIVAFLSLFLWLVATFTDHWFHIRRSDALIKEAFNVSKNSAQEIFIRSNAGLWRYCEHFETTGGGNRLKCEHFSIFLGKDESNWSPRTINEHVVDYTRVQICFAFISILLMTMTIVAAFYTFKNSRYVYKRLAACLYFMTTISVLVVLEVLVTSVKYAEGAKLYPHGSFVEYGFSFYMGWSVFLVYLVNGCMFLVMSRKMKYDDIDDDDLDGRQIMGR